MLKDTGDVGKGWETVPVWLHTSLHFVSNAVIALTCLPADFVLEGSPDIIEVVSSVLACVQWCNEP